jgi:hypothetical protein
VSAAPLAAKAARLIGKEILKKANPPKADKYRITNTEYPPAMHRELGELNIEL